MKVYFDLCLDSQSNYWMLSIVRVRVDFVKANENRDLAHPDDKLEWTTLSDGRVRPPGLYFRRVSPLFAAAVHH